MSQTHVVAASSHSKHSKGLTNSPELAFNGRDVQFSHTVNGTDSGPTGLV